MPYTSIIPHNGEKVKFTPVKIALYALGLCAWTFLALEISSFVFAYLLYFFLGAETLTTPLWTTIYNALMYLGAFALTAIVPYKLFKRFKAKRPTRTSLGLKKTPTWVDLGLAPVGFVAYLIGAAALTALFSLFSWFNADQAQNVGYSTYLVGPDLIVAFIALVLIAPIAEELIFRGYLYGKLRGQLKLSALAAAIIVSLLFALLHGQWNVAVNVFALSLVLCTLREITGTIYSGIFLHMIKNGVAFYFLYVAHSL